MDSTNFSMPRSRSSGQSSSTSPPLSTSSSSGSRKFADSAVMAPPAAQSAYLPSRRELSIYAIFPALLLFGGAYTLVSPTMRSSTYDPVVQGHTAQPGAVLPSYFASKRNVFNRFFVKVGWAWVTAAVGGFAVLSPALGISAGAGAAAAADAAEAVVLRRARVLLRYAAATVAWALTTQWFFGPPLIDRSFRWSGGMCYPVEAFGPTGVLVASVEIAADKAQHAPAAAADAAQNMLVFTATACKRVGGRWYGGHDISGHVFLLVLGAGLLLQEVGWVMWPRGGRALVGAGGAVGEVRARSPSASVGVTGKFALGVVALQLWMLLMTAIYFHTWFEKLTGLLTATIALYVVYVVPRFVPFMRAILGVPGLD
ncbi:hypothetical protein BROUX41_004218 [Berkeleyomyces rouxiae]|uniref:uncharacterized protein n=1 Tax=Berkeleyomyces rouxiae TaxID=2035830 RepID=UPI003B7B3FAA